MLMYNDKNIKFGCIRTSSGTSSIEAPKLILMLQKYEINSGKFSKINMSTIIACLTI